MYSFFPREAISKRDTFCLNFVILSLCQLFCMSQWHCAKSIIELISQIGLYIHAKSKRGRKNL